MPKAPKPFKMPTTPQNPPSGPKAKPLPAAKPTKKTKPNKNVKINPIKPSTVGNPAKQKKYL